MGKNTRKLSLEDKVVVKDGLLVKELEDKVVILDVEGGEVRKLNEVASWIFRYLEKEKLIKEVIEGLRSEFEVGAERAERDVLNFVDGYVELGYFELLKR